MGQTMPLDPERFPLVSEPLCKFHTTLGRDKPFSTMDKAAEEQRSGNDDNVEWGLQGAKAMCDQTQGFPIPVGSMTVGDIYDLTDQDLISKVGLQGKVFDTWFHGRTVLLGDGAMIAMHDAAALANLVYALLSYSIKDLDVAFQEYKAERYPPALESFKSSQLVDKGIERGFAGVFARFTMQHKPDWLWRLILKGMIRNRPLVGYLPEVKAKGTIPPNVSPSTVKAKAIYEKRTAAVSV
ncbi:hypothetical protein BGX33_009915 [Mortierella sp. NVP41]|nr:hypothetical protein BGX33_009915 [Mortierella sp. NVP41]